MKLMVPKNYNYLINFHLLYYNHIIMSNDNDCCCVCFEPLVDKIDNFWEKYKYKISGKFSIVLSVLGGVSSILAAKLIVPASIMGGVCSVGIFFAGVSLENFKNDNVKLNTDNISLQNEKNDIVRRLTQFHFPSNENEPINANNDDNSVSANTTPSNNSTSTIRPIDFQKLYLNSIVSIKATE